MQIRNLLWRFIFAAAVLAFVTPSAFAQQPFMPSFSLGENKRKLTPEEQEKQDALDKDYKSATTKIPDQKPTDPWGTVRPQPSTPAPKKKPQ